jgi:uncharacterized membrane protein
MLKKTILFIATLLTAASVSTGYGSTDALKGAVNPEIFLDWFIHAEKYVHSKGLIVLDLIPILFLIVQTVLFFKDREKAKGILTGLALLANLIGVFFVIQYAYPIASQLATWTPDTVPANWIELKDDWLNYIGLHGLMGMVGWLCFVITYFITKRENSDVRRLPRFLNFSKNALLFLLVFILGPGVARLYEFGFFLYSYEISGVTFIEMHRPLDLAIRKVGPILFTIIASIHLALVAFFFFEKSKNKGWLILAALGFLLCDTFIALQYNGPINDLFLTWTPATIPTNWASIRDQWLQYHLYRDLFIVLGFSSILLTFFVQKNKSSKQSLHS